MLRTKLPLQKWMWCTFICIIWSAYFVYFMCKMYATYKKLSMCAKYVLNVLIKLIHVMHFAYILHRTCHAVDYCIAAIIICLPSQPISLLRSMHWLHCSPTELNSSADTCCEGWKSPCKKWTILLFFGVVLIPSVYQEQVYSYYHFCVWHGHCSGFRATCKLSIA